MADEPVLTPSERKAIDELAHDAARLPQSSIFARSKRQLGALAWWANCRLVAPVLFLRIGDRFIPAWPWRPIGRALVALSSRLEPEKWRLTSGGFYAHD